MWGYIESALGWMERTERGRQMIALILSAGWAVWAFIANRYPPEAIVAIAVVLTWMVLEIEEHLIPRLREWLGPPAYIDITGMSVNFIEATEQTQEFARKLGRHHPVQSAVKISFPIYLLNRSKRRRISLRTMAFRIDRPHPEMGLSISGGSEQNPWIDLGGLTLNLGPDEDSRAMASIHITEGKAWVSGQHDKILVFKDEVSGRYARVEIPGRYPPKRKASVKNNG